MQKLVIIGEGADVLGIDKLFSNETSLPSESLTLLKNVESYNRIKLSNSLLKQYMANIGASLDPINFQPKTSLVTTKKTGTNNTTYMLFGLVLIVAAVALTLFPMFKYKGLENDRDELEENISKIKDIEEFSKNVSYEFFKDNLKYMTFTSNNPKFLRDLEKEKK